MLTAAIYTLLGIHVIVCLLMALVVLMQRPKNEGLGAAFGGGMTENLFGAQTTSVLANFTRWLGGVFFLLTLTLSVLYAKQSTTTKSAIQQKLMQSPKPVAAPSATLPSPKAAPSAAGMASPGVPALRSSISPAPASRVDAVPAVSPK